VYDQPFWAATPWLNRLPGAPYNGRWMEMFNLGLFVPQLPALVAFNAAGAAWSAEQDSDEELTRQAREPRQLQSAAPAALLVQESLGGCLSAVS